MKTSKNKKTGQKRILIQAKEISYKNGKNVYGKSRAVTVYDTSLNKLWKIILKALNGE